MAEGLFGPSPWEIQQAQQQGLRQQAAAYAKQSPMERAAAGMYQAGGMLGGMGAEALGGRNIAVENARRTEQIMGEGDTDLGTAAGMAAKADQFRKAGDLRTATALTMKANEMKRQEAAAAHLTAKDDLAERRFQEAEKVKISNDAQAKADALEAKIQMAKDKLAQEEREGKRDYARQMEIAKMVNMLGYAQIEARKAAAEAKAAAGGDGMTPAQRGKLDMARKDVLANTLGVDNEIAETIGQIELVKQHKGADAATGPIAGKLLNMRQPTIDYENQVEGSKGKLTKIAKDLMSESGKIGSMQVQEWQILLNTIAAIRPSMGKQNINIAFDNVIADLERKRDVHYAKMQEKYGTQDSPIEKPALKIPTKGSRYVEGGRTTTGQAQRVFKVLGKE